MADIGDAAQEIGEFRRRERRHSVGNGRIICRGKRRDKNALAETHVGRGDRVRHAVTRRRR